MRQLTLTRPDDFHLHLRDGNYLASTVADAARCFARGLIMPNRTPPTTDVESARAYRTAILAAIPTSADFEPLMTLYITDETDAATVSRAKACGFIHAFKLYPAGVTTNAASGVTNLDGLSPLLEAMQRADMPLAVHGEVTDPQVDIFDREAAFIDQYLDGMRQRFPALRIIFEHITTRAAVDWVLAQTGKTAATITSHHLLYNRNDLLAGGMKPLYYCLPVLKRNTHQMALVDAATSGDPRFFLGTDSAPHPRSAKENVCGCAAGCYTAHAGIELYAEVFAAQDQLVRLEAFASHYGADFYGLRRNAQAITLTERPWRVPDELAFGNDCLVPIRGGENIHWTLEQEVPA
jgi:dihydroorotase